MKKGSKNKPQPKIVVEVKKPKRKQKPKKQRTTEQEAITREKQRLASIGNNYWRMRTTHGRDKQYKTPEELMLRIDEYFKYVDDNPLMMAVLHQRDCKIVQVPKMRPYTLEGMCTFLDLSCDGFRLYEKRTDFIDVCTRARQIIYNQKFEGAASGFLNHAIIARDLGLKDKQEIQHAGSVQMLPALPIGMKVHKAGDNKEKK